ncbi:hypothetical protein BGX27_007607, partial [Mortierella sp. AM989]
HSPFDKNIKSDLVREAKAEKELLDRLKSHAYGDVPLNVHEDIWKEILEEEKGDLEVDSDQTDEDDSQSEAEEEEEDEDEEREFVSDQSEDEEDMEDMFEKEYEVKEKMPLACIDECT